jgi:DNA repair protein RadA/Sms
MRCAFKSDSFSVVCPSCENSNTLKLTQSSLFAAVEPPTIVEPKGLVLSQKEDDSILPIRARVSPLDRVQTGLGTLDTALGGGFVVSSSTLLGGDWGSGKSTLALRIADSVPHSLYVASEENREQVEDRATRTGRGIGCPLLCTRKVERIARAIVEADEGKTGLDKVALVIIDSINKLEGSLLDVANDLERLCRSRRIALVAVAQMVKDGTIAGPNEMGHLFDTVIVIEKTDGLTRDILVDKSRFAPSPARYPLRLSELGWVEVPLVETDRPSGDKAGIGGGTDRP